MNFESNYYKLNNILKAEVRLTYLKRPYIITMGTFQMAILLCLNATTTITVKDLLESTQLPEKDLIKQVQSLLDSKIITSNDPKGETSKVQYRLNFFLN